MNSRNDRFEYGLATNADSEQLLEIFESGDYKGNVSVLFTRRPDPYLSLMSEGEKVVIPIARDTANGRICAVGCCVVRKAYINGAIKNTGYLTGLKILPEYQMRMPHIADIYQFLYEQTKGLVDIYYTTILKENIAAQRFLEKRHRNMPLYNYAGEYTVFCFKTGTKLMPGRYRNLSKYVLIKGNLEGLADFYEIRIKGFNFSPINIVLHGLSELHDLSELHGLPKEDIYTLRDSNGEILAACGVWNQQGCKQYIITGYNGVYKYLRHLPLKMLGYPRFPRENEPVNYASIAMLCVKDNNAELAQYFVKMVAERSTGFDFLMAGFLERHPLMPAFIGIKHIKYQSRLYTVQWQDAEDILDGRPINLEVGLL